MKLRVTDFEILTKNYSNYQDGIKRIEEEKKDFIKSLEPVKKEMESIISQMSSGLIVDETTQKEKEEKFRSLQEQAMNIDNQFKTEMHRLHDELNKKTFDELSEIIDTYSKSNDIDMVIGKMEVVYLKEEFEITNDIVEVLKEKNLYYSSETTTQTEVLEETTTETNN
jgi:Skp family chaperone for outer membrane proteins